MPPTPRDICIAWVRKTNPECPEADIEERARQFFRASPTGELWHVFCAGRILGILPSDDVTKRTECH